MTYFWMFFNIHLSIIVSRKLERFLMFFERHIKNFLRIFFFQQWKSSGLRGRVWLLIAWLDPIHFTQGLECGCVVWKNNCFPLFSSNKPPCANYVVNGGCGYISSIVWKIIGCGSSFEFFFFMTVGATCWKGCQSWQNTISNSLPRSHLWHNIF